MGTRATFIVTDEHDSLQLYCQYDGYPDYMMPKIAEALDYAWALPRFDAADFIAALVCVLKSKGGGNVYFQGDADGFKRIGWASYVYVIDASLTRRVKFSPSDGRNQWRSESGGSTSYLDSTDPIVSDVPMVQVYGWDKYTSIQTDSEDFDPVPNFCVPLTRTLEWERYERIFKNSTFDPNEVFNSILERVEALKGQLKGMNGVGDGDWHLHDFTIPFKMAMKPQHAESRNTLLASAKPNIQAWADDRRVATILRDVDKLIASKLWGGVKGEK